MNGDDDASVTFAETLEELQQQDPPPTEITFHLDDRPDEGTVNYDVALSQALETNDSIEEVTLLVSPRYTRIDQWRSVLSVLRSGRAGKGVTEIYLVGGVHPDAPPDQDERENMLAIARTILQEIQGLSTLKSLCLAVSVSGDVLSSFLDHAPPVFKSLDLYVCDVGSSEIPCFAAAVERRNKVQPLSLKIPCGVSTLELLRNFSDRKVSYKGEGSSFRINLNSSGNEACLPMILRFLSSINISEVLFAEVPSEAVFNQIMNNIPSFAQSLGVSLGSIDE